MTRWGIVAAAAVVFCAVASQIVLPELGERRVESRLTENGGTAEVKLGAVPAVRLLFGDGERFEVRAREIDLDLDRDDAVLEASRANVFIVESGEMITPPTDGRLLAGVTRRRLLELVPVREEPISLDRLLAADEVFLTGSVRGVEPVRDYNGTREWSEGELTAVVSDHLRRRWEAEP